MAQQSLVTSLISRGVTCVADNLLTSVLHHKHPHELLDSVVKERWLSLSPQPRRAFYSVLRICQAVISTSFKVSFATSTTCASINFALLVSGRRILQDPKAVSNAFSHRCRSRCNRSPSRLTPRTVKHLQTIDLQGFFSSVCAGSGANYREIKSPVNR